MATIVRQLEGVWSPISGTFEVEMLVDRYTAQFADGRSEERECEPYPIEVTLDAAKVRQLLNEGVWTDTDLSAHGLKIALPMEVPEGQQIIGAPRYVESEGDIIETFDLEDLPPPAPEPTAEEKLAAAGLTVEELRILILGEQDEGED